MESRLQQTRSENQVSSSACGRMQKDIHSVDTFALYFQRFNFLLKFPEHKQGCVQPQIAQNNMASAAGTSE